MKKILPLLLIFVISALTACGGNRNDVINIVNAAIYESEPAAERHNLKLGVAPGPYGDMFMETILPYLEPKGYSVELVLYDDFVKPNLALGNYEVDLNMFQHYRYLNGFKSEHDLDLSAIAEIPTVSMGVFSVKYRTLEEIEYGAVVTIPDDATNLARALRVLDAAGVVTIDPHADSSRATEADLSKNLKNVVFNKVEAPRLVESLNNSDVVVINGNFAYAGGLNISEALYNEVLHEGFVNVIAVRTEDLSRQFVIDILDVIHSGEFKGAITDIKSKYSGFQRPRYFLS